MKCALATAVFALACSAGSAGSSERPTGSGSTTGSGGAINPGVGGAFGTGGGITLADGGLTGGTGGMEACATESAQAMLTTQPIDIILVLDNSGSMVEEMHAAEANINDNFATILSNAGVDYRVILLSRHRSPDQSAEAQSTSICVTTPLSSLSTCPAPMPGFSERFYQYSEKIESFDALNWLIDGWNTAPADDDYAILAPTGYHGWLRPGAKKVIVLMTDDDESNDDVPASLLTVEQFLTQFTALAPDQLGSAGAPTFRFHSIIGIDEKADPTAPYTPDEPINTTECDGNGANIESYGPTYQELSIRTQGLRFPLCQFPGYDAVFQAIADDVIVQAILTCDFAIPEPPLGKTLELEKVAVVQTRADGTQIGLKQAPTPADCASDLFYIQNGRVWLCEDACNAIRSQNGANVEVLFTCESQIVVQ